MSRTYRCKKGYRPWTTRRQSCYGCWRGLITVEYTDEDRAKYERDGARWRYKHHPYMKEHINFLRRTRERRVEQNILEAVDYDCVDVENIEKRYAHLKWCYD